MEYLFFNVIAKIPQNYTNCVLCWSNPRRLNLILGLILYADLQSWSPILTFDSNLWAFTWAQKLAPQTSFDPPCNFRPSFGPQIFLSTYPNLFVSTQMSLFYQPGLPLWSILMTRILMFTFAMNQILAPKYTRSQESATLRFQNTRPKMRDFSR